MKRPPVPQYDAARVLSRVVQQSGCFYLQHFCLLGHKAFEETPGTRDTHTTGHHRANNSLSLPLSARFATPPELLR